jgi:hypothetical protein
MQPVHGTPATVQTKHITMMCTENAPWNAPPTHPGIKATVLPQGDA